jgi:hypothetical protein
MTASRARELAVYDGQECIGMIKLADGGEAVAFDQHGKRRGSFPSFKAASDALGSIEKVPQRTKTRSVRKPKTPIKAT